VKSLSAKLGHVLVLYGAWGLFAMSFLDSSLIPFPVVNDVALIMMASRRPAWWPFYALATTLGSVCGAYLLYGIARGGGKYFWRKTTPQSVSRAQHWLARHDFVAILVASLLPPPAPLKVFLLTAGMLRVNAVTFGLALLVGRGLRFGAEAWLGARYGVQAEDYIRHNLGWTSLAVIGLIIGLALLRRYARRDAGDGNRETGNGTRDTRYGKRDEGNRG
jgi:membrane protein YqaA with SNARE-associated domain